MTTILDGQALAPAMLTGNATIDTATLGQHVRVRFSNDQIKQIFSVDDQSIQGLLVAAFAGLFVLPLSYVVRFHIAVAYTLSAGHTITLGTFIGANEAGLDETAAIFTVDAIGDPVFFQSWDEGPQTGPADASALAPQALTIAGATGSGHITGGGDDANYLDVDVVVRAVSL